MKKLLIIFLCLSLNLYAENYTENYPEIEKALNQEAEKLLELLENQEHRPSEIQFGTDDFLRRLLVFESKFINELENKFINEKSDNETEPDIQKEAATLQTDSLLPWCPPKEPDKWYNCKGKYTWKNGSMYIGEYKNNLMHGFGIYLSASGDTYVGELKNNTRHGQGTYYYSMNAEDDWKGTRVVAEWRDGKPNGQGIFYRNNGDKYVGEFKDGEFFKGTLFHLSDDEAFKNFKGNKYIGEFKKKNMDGKGIYFYSNGGKYIGGMKKNSRHGHGAYYYPNNDKYVGEFKDGVPNGQGTYFHLADNELKGSKYVGGWKNNLTHGAGTYFYSSGDKDEGIWDLGKFMLSTQKDEPMEDESMASSEISTPDTISDNDEFKERYSGSGFMVSKLGHIVTNHHVINGCNSVYVEHELERGKSIKVKIVDANKKEDLALLQTVQEKNSKIKFAFFSIRQSNPERYDKIRVLGFPLGIHLKRMRGRIDAMPSDGIVTVKDWTPALFQIDARIQPGNSGGPVLDENTNVIGVAQKRLDKKAFEEETGVKPEGFNYAIKASILNKFLHNNDIDIKTKKSSVSLNRKLGIHLLTKAATYYVSCRMNQETYTKMKTERVFFEDIQ